jgi:predicted PurR-regulated permease PerM
MPNAARRPIVTDDTARPRGPVVAMALLALAALALVVVAGEAVFVGFMGVLLGVAFSHPVRLLSRFMPRAAAVLLTLTLTCGAIAGLVVLSVPTLSQQAGEITKQAPAAVERLRSWFGRVTGREHSAAGDSEGGELEPEKVLAKALPAAVGLLSIVSAAALVAILAAFFAYSPESYAAALRSLVPRAQEPIFDETWRRLGRGLSGWAGATLLDMTIMGTLTAVGMMIAGIDAWPLLGLLTFLGTSVPYVGALASSVPGLILGLAKSPRHFAIALFVYLLVHVVEGYVVQPFLMKRAVELKPAVLLLWQLLMGAAFGVLGIVIATPLLVCLEIVIGYLYIERQLGKAAPDS